MQINTSFKNSIRQQHPGKSVSNALALLFLLIIGTVLWGCGGTGRVQLGKAIPDNLPVVALADVMASPAEYNGKSFVMKGTVSGQCASLCEFAFKDGLNKATIYPQGYEFPKLAIGKPVTVYVQATSGQEQVVFSALGLKME